MADAPAWVQWEAAKWLVGTQYLDRTTEYIFFRLTQISYEAGDAIIDKSDAFNAMRCKSTLDEYVAAIDLLEEMGKVERVENGIFLPSTDKRLERSNAAMTNRQRGAKISRRKRELLEIGRSSDEIALIINKEFPDDQDPKKERKKDIKTHAPEVEQNSLDLVPELQEPSTVEKAVNRFNDMADQFGLSKVQKLSDTRKRALKARLKDVGGYEEFEKVLFRAAKSKFLMGKANSDWKLTFDWLVKPANFLKITEGNYDEQGNGRSSEVMNELDKL